MGEKSGFFHGKAFLNLLRIAGILISLGCGAVAILNLFGSTIKLNPIEILVSIYICFFGLLSIVGELKIVFIIQWFKFMAPFIGFGFYYVFFGVLLFVRNHWYNYLVGAFAIGLGVIYIIVGCAGVERMDASDIAKREQRDKAEKYAVSTAANAAASQNTAENREKLAAAAAAENGKKSNPFDNDNPFNGGSAY
eukprot:UN00031